MPSPSSAAQQRSPFIGRGRAQLSLVEHSLCPLDSAASLRPGSLHTVSYDFWDGQHNCKTARATVACPFGLSANDELYLYGLLALSFAQAEPSIDFYATPHYCLRRLGIVDPQAEQGKRYEVFRGALRRLAGVVYQNDHFYDPVRGEHRDVAFGFLKYSLPLAAQSSRAWHLVWDPQFYRFCEATRGSFQFDFDLYRRLDYASRRLLLLLQKIFWRNDASPVFEVRHLAVNVLGFAGSVPTKILKSKIARAAGRLLDEEVIRLPPGGANVHSLLSKRAKGWHEVRFLRGPYFDRHPATTRAPQLDDSPLYEPLSRIGFEPPAIRRIVGRFTPQLVQQWSDITLAAMERGMIKKSPQSFFMHYIQEAKERRTTPPDWWHELQRREREQRRSEEQAVRQSDTDEAFDDYLRTEAREAFDRVMDRVFRGLCDAGQAEHEAREHAEYTARMHMRQQFRRDYPEKDDQGMTRLGDLL